ncbi:uncharacterized protein LOC116204882 [Punica granatum]|uniref:Uncharacterized protein n=2 Tax=Punica granatum TaxID=22663 RepID=A0A2I0J9M5_PUNGR|nr:uncharacterized protein LOC116204882 [Punica granatum]PKI52947.1 hypothetical protein CRG98_026653 [Punica granatum]
MGLIAKAHFNGYLLSLSLSLYEPEQSGSPIAYNGGTSVNAGAMSLTISSLPSARLSLGNPPQLRSKPTFAAQFWPRFHGRTIPFDALRPRTLPAGQGFAQKIFLLPRANPELLGSRNIEFRLNAESDGGTGAEMDEAERAARGESTMPERFRYLTKEAPDPPVRWPFFVAAAFLIYAWRAVLFELSNWRKALWAIVGLVGYLLKLLLALIFHFIGDPVTSTIRFIETTLYSIRAFYSSIVSYAPVPELTTVIILASLVLAIAEAVVPDAVKSQPKTLTFSGLIGYAAVKGYISEPFFWTLLVGIYGFSRLIKRRDDVSSALPAAAVMVGIGEPWVRAVVIISYLAVAMYHHSRKLSKGNVAEEEVMERRLPLPLLGVALAIGIRVAAKWAGYRHLTWMTV